MILLENNYGKVRCKACDSVFKLEKGDLRWSHTEEDMYYFKCPICGEIMWFDEDHPYVQASKTGIFVHK